MSERNVEDIYTRTSTVKEALKTIASSIDELSMAKQLGYSPDINKTYQLAEQELKLAREELQRVSAQESPAKQELERMVSLLDSILTHRSLCDAGHCRHGGVCDSIRQEIAN